MKNDLYGGEPPVCSPGERASRPGDQQHAQAQEGGRVYPEEEDKDTECYGNIVFFLNRFASFFENTKQEL